MSPLRFAIVMPALVLTTGLSSGVTPDEVKAAVRKGVGYLQPTYQNATPAQIAEGAEGFGPAALAGLALFEAGVPGDDPAVRAITAGIREAAFAETRTYQLTLGILFLDRLGDPADGPIVQLLGVRLIAGQNGRGGWTYGCVDAVPAAEVSRLRKALTVAELKTERKRSPSTTGDGTAPAKPKTTVALDPEVKKYTGRLVASQSAARGDDNSNTQFGTLGLWVARGHGVSVETALERVERRFLTTQTANGGWAYTDFTPGTPSMTCAGLLGLATAIGRREERRLKSGPSGLVAATGAARDHPSDARDVAPPGVGPVPKEIGGRKRPADARDVAVQKALASLAAVLADQGGKGRRDGGLLGGNVLGDRDYYFLWSLERVGVIYGIDTIGKLDWYALGATALLDAQLPNGGWGRPARGTIVETAFAVLFLSRSNLVRDLTATIQKSKGVVELRSGPLPATPAVAPPPRADVVAVSPPPAPRVTAPATPRVKPTGSDVPDLVADLTDAPGSNWRKRLAGVRDAEGEHNTQALVAAIGRVGEDQRPDVREALAERLSRATNEAVRAAAKSKDRELRRASIVAMALRGDPGFIPDLVTALGDDDGPVMRAARSGLYSLTGEDFGPDSAADRGATVRCWNEWFKRQKR